MGPRMRVLGKIGMQMDDDQLNCDEGAGEWNAASAHLLTVSYDTRIDHLIFRHCWLHIMDKFELVLLNPSGRSLSATYDEVRR